MASFALGMRRLNVRRHEEAGDIPSRLSSGVLPRRTLRACSFPVDKSGCGNTYSGRRGDRGTDTMAELFGEMLLATSTRKDAHAKRGQLSVEDETTAMHFSGISHIMAMSTLIERKIQSPIWGNR